MTAIRYVVMFATLCFTHAQYNDYQPQEAQQPSRALEVPEYIAQSQQPVIAYTLQLPRLETSDVPFYNPEIQSDLRPPSNDANIPIIFYEYPVPSQGLQVPPIGSWNPNNDPNLYYDNAAVNDYDTPTNTHPKKYNKDVHEKIKQVIAESKKEIPKPSVDELVKQQKVVDKFAKLENQKENKKVSNVFREDHEPQSEASEPHFTHIDDNVAEDISSSITHSLGVNALPGERYQYHMHGHKGPNSYKWGFDTGKGNNRQFRFEERDQDGHVKGKYGYYDTAGKLHMFHYNAGPEDGFNAKSDSDDQDH